MAGFGDILGPKPLKAISFFYDVNEERFITKTTLDAKKRNEYTIVDVHCYGSFPCFCLS